MGNTEFITKATQLVTEYANDHVDKADSTSIDADDVYVVWNCFILGNIKALLSTSIPDGMYYEVTFNKARNEIYFDAYKKIENRQVEV